MSDAAPDVSKGSGDHEALNAMLDRFQLQAIVAGAAMERARIAAILNSPQASGLLKFAWELAHSGLDVDQALKALTLAKVVSALPPIDPGAALSH